MAQVWFLCQSVVRRNQESIEILMASVSAFIFHKYFIFLLGCLQLCIITSITTGFCLYMLVIFYTNFYYFIILKNVENALFLLKLVGFLLL